MPLYTFECDEHGRQVVHRAMSEAAEPHACAGCRGETRRVFDVPQFSEDRLRFQRNPRTGKDHSDMLGTAYPKDRRERDAIYKMKGIEPVSRREMPAQWKRAADYAQHLKDGGEPVKDVKTLIDKPDLSSVKTIKQRMDESGFRFGA